MTFEGMDSVLFFVFLDRIKQAFFWKAWKNYPENPVNPVKKFI